MSARSHRFSVAKVSPAEIDEMCVSALPIESSIMLFLSHNAMLLSYSFTHFTLTTISERFFALHFLTTSLLRHHSHCRLRGLRVVHTIKYCLTCAFVKHLLCFAVHSSRPRVFCLMTTCIQFINATSDVDAPAHFSSNHLVKDLT